MILGAHSIKPPSWRLQLHSPAGRPLDQLLEALLDRKNVRTVEFGPIGSAPARPAPNGGESLLPLLLLPERALDEIDATSGSILVAISGRLSSRPP